MDASSFTVKLAPDGAGGQVVDGWMLGGFAIDPLGRLSLEPGAVGRFGFRWRGRHVALELQPDAGGAGRCQITLRSCVGRMPSTALSAALRPAALRLPGRLGTMLPAGWQLRLLADHRLQVLAEERLSLPARIGDLLAPSARFVLSLAPYLDLLEEHGIAMRA